MSLLLWAPDVARALPCEHDDALAQAAAEVLGRELTPANLAREAREAGSDAPTVHALRDPQVDDARVAEWIGRLRARSDGDLVCGEAQGEGGRVVLAAVRAGGLEGVPGDSSRLRGWLARGFDRPELVIRSADGALLRLGADPQALRRGFALPEDVELPALVQLVARGPHGPRPVAERSVGGHFDAGASFGGDQELPVRIGELRELRGASPLRPNRLLDAEAAAHAGRVCEAGRVAHTLARGADPEARLASRGIRARVVGETVARASSPAAAMDALVRSPSHQYTLVDRRFTDVGVGTAHDRRGRTCVVVLLAAWPRYVGALANRRD